MATVHYEKLSVSSGGFIQIIDHRYRADCPLKERGGIKGDGVEEEEKALCVV